jgi:hypothetical protein
MYADNDDVHKVLTIAHDWLRLQALMFIKVMSFVFLEGGSSSTLCQ